MVEKVENAEMTCKGCGSDLVCHMSKYEGEFENHLQWQNSDGSAHYKWKSAGKYDCVIPDNENNETPEQAENESSQTEIPKVTALDEDMRYVKNKVDSIFAMINEQYKEYIDRKTNS